MDLCLILLQHVNNNSTKIQHIIFLKLKLVKPDHHDELHSVSSTTLEWFNNLQVTLCNLVLILF